MSISGRARHIVQWIEVRPDATNHPETRVLHGAKDAA